MERMQDSTRQKYEEQIGELRSEIDKMRLENAEKDIAKKDINIQLFELTSELNNLKSENALLQAKAERYKNEIDALQQQLQAGSFMPNLDGENSISDQSVTREMLLEEQVKAYREKIDRLENEIQKAKLEQPGTISMERELAGSDVQTVRFKPARRRV